MRRLGIAIVTYNREKILAETISRIREFTTGEYDLVVSDDGSADGTVAYCRKNNIPCITAPNSGIAANKNRGIYALLHYFNADTILILEDDCQPEVRSWNEHWQSITERWQHVCYGPVSTWPKEVIKAGTGTIDDPYRMAQLTAQITGVTREALNKVGYLSPLFAGYGHEHVEWTRRFAQAG